MVADARNVTQCVAPFLDGAYRESRSEALVEVTNPSNGRPLVSIPRGCDEDVELAVASARCAFADRRWRDLPPSFRKKVLHRWADLIAAEAADLDALDAGEMGKPIREMFANAASAAGLARFYAEALDKIAGDVYCSDKGSFVTQRRVARGIVAAISPWNFPTYNAVLKVAPAVAAGNSDVLKPSELSSRSALRIAELAVRAGLPPGILNVVPGLGETVGQALGLHGDVDMVTFTGSTDVGKQILQNAARSNMKVVMAECGGKSPHVVFDDCIDVDAVSARIAQMLLTNQGQICSVGSRLLVQHSIEEQVLDRIITRLRGIVMGDALDPKTTFGPVASAQQCARVMRYIETAESEGARLVAGGHRTLAHSGGYFVEPTVFRNVSPAARIAQDEIFGPVLCVMPFRDEAEAISLANSTVYGLTAYVWTASLPVAMRMADGIRSSMRVNAAPPSGEGPGYASSFEPHGLSGLGTEGGVAGMESYLRRQVVSFNYG